MNVILILADTLRFDHLGCYGNNWIKTPNIDRLASEGTLFTRAYSEGLPTLPTRTAIYTGRYTFPFRGWQRLEFTDIIISEVLWDKGYTTALVSDVGHAHRPGMGYGRGFDLVHWIRGQEADPYVVDPDVKVDISKYHEKNWMHGGDAAWQAKMKPMLEQFLRNTAHWKGEEDTFIAQVEKAGIRCLRQLSEEERDFFLFLDSFDPHGPWNPPSPYDKMYADLSYAGKPIINPVPGEVEGYLTEEELRHIRALYAGDVTLVDTWIGLFLDEVRRLGLMDNTLVIFLSDHGEPLGEGEWGHGIIRKAKPWPYEELTHIPFIVKHLDSVGKREKTEAFVETCDVMPTILDFLGIPHPKEVHGESVLPLISGEKKSIRDYAYSGFYRSAWSIRDEEWKYILWLDGRKPELYNLRKDRHEQKNLIEEDPRRADELELTLRRFVANLK